MTNLAQYVETDQDCNVLNASEKLILPKKLEK